MRSSHAANDGKVFAWDDPPPTGHPGEDFGCRCTAEPFYQAIEEYVDITFSGNGSEKNGVLSISGKLDFYLEDEFKDPLDLFDIIPGDNLDLPGSQTYRIYDKWRGQFEGQIYADQSKSAFR